jgi:hypothetical protein
VGHCGTKLTGLESLDGLGGFGFRFIANTTASSVSQLRVSVRLDCGYDFAYCVSDHQLDCAFKCLPSNLLQNIEGLKPLFNLKYLYAFPQNKRTSLSQHFGAFSDIQELQLNDKPLIFRQLKSHRVVLKTH